MCNQILPLSINKNKYDEKVTKNNVEKHYYQILENVKKAHKESVISYSLTTMDIDPDYKDEAEALTDLILNCVTRLDFIHHYENDVDFKNYVHRVISDVKSVYYLKLFTLIFLLVLCKVITPLKWLKSLITCKVKAAEVVLLI